MNNTPKETDVDETSAKPLGRQKPTFIQASLKVKESDKSVESAKADLEVEDPKDEKAVAALLNFKEAK
jgi:hypothetical protein